VTARAWRAPGGLLTVALWTACGAPPPAELILVGGKIVTLDPERPEARALAARDGIVVAVGDEDEVLRHRGPLTRVIRLDGRLAVPGFIEGHGHFPGLGRALQELDLRGARSWSEVVDLVRGAAQRAGPGAWILGRGWHQEKWDAPPPDAVEGYPVHEQLSRATPDNPVLLRHASGSHAALVNARALALAGIGPDTPDPPGGTILRDERGRPTGVLRETAATLALEARAADLARRPPETVEAQERHALRLADAECLRKGITSFHDAGSDFATIDRLRAMAEAGELGVRLWVMILEDNAALEERVERYRIVDACQEHLTVRAVKRWIDGALGSHGAWLLEPYSDLPQSTGLNTTPVAEIERTAEIAMRHDLQLCVHAIGDRANREVLDLYERSFARHPDRHDLRWRIEHAQHLDPHDVPRFAALGVIAAMQAIHCTSDGPWVPERLGPERSREGAYVWRKLLDSGARVVNGTDAPIEDVDPLASFHAAVTRRMGSGEAFHPEQAMTRVEALRSYTLDAAYAAFEDARKGSLRPGKLADVTVLSQDILTVPEERIRDTEVVHTIVGGRVLYP
jgi:predicted amidohydrolase YtcJ